MAQILLCFVVNTKTKVVTEKNPREKCIFKVFHFIMFVSQERNKVLLDRVRMEDLRRSGDLIREIDHENQKIEISLKAKF